MEEKIRFRGGNSGPSISVGSGKMTAEGDLSREGCVIGFLRGRWVRMIIFLMACFLTAPLYYGWQQYAQMLGRSGAYGWYCGEDHDFDVDGMCHEQEVAIGRLYSIAAGCEYASAAWGGILLDNVGPRISGFVGELLFGIGTILLMFSSESFPAYIPAMIILGSCVNMVCFPSLVTIETFPQWKGVMVSLMLGAQTAATGIPPIMWAAWRGNPTWTFRGIWGVYLAAFWIPTFILYMIALPSARDFQNILKLQRKELLALNTNKQFITEAELEDPIKQELLPVAVKKASWTEFGGNIITLDMMVMGFWFYSMMCAVSPFS